MQAYQALFYLKEWFLVGLRHLGTPIGHLVRWQSHLQKVSLHKPFSKQGIILCGVKMFLLRH